MSSATIKTTVKGHVQIKDAKTGEVLLDKPNAVNNLNMAIALARGLSNQPATSTGVTTYQIYALALGNGGSSVDSMNQITYLPPNVNGTSAKLYSQTYYKVVDEQQSGTAATDSVTYQVNSANNTTIVVVAMTIPAGQPSGQDLTDSPPDPNFNSTYAFDELGLYTYGATGSFTNTTAPSDALMLTHIIFSPILKTSNRELVCSYTLTIAVS